MALSLVRERYADFGPTFAAEKLAAYHGCSVSHETLRGWMIADGLWVDRRHRVSSPHRPRRRRDCLGELVQIDGSEHAWFKARGETCTSLAFIDDATSRLMQLRFVASESAFDYFRTTLDYWKPMASQLPYYSDKHGIFRVTPRTRSATEVRVVSVTEPLRSLSHGWRAGRRCGGFALGPLDRPVRLI